MIEFFIANPDQYIYIIVLVTLASFIALLIDQERGLPPFADFVIGGILAIFWPIWIPIAFFLIVLRST